MPERIQRKRTRGWRTPPGVVHVVRGTRWGNPYPVGAVIYGVKVRDRAHAVELFRDFLRGSSTRVDMIRRELAGKDLACWCPLDGQPCHADVLLRVAAGGEP